MNPEHLNLAQYIRAVPDFPHAGILYRDITPLLNNTAAFQFAIAQLAEHVQDGITHIAAIESRGFIFATPLACRLNLPFVPIRKKGKLPCPTYDAAYQLEYGQAEISIHRDALDSTANVLLIDDILATGGTLAASQAVIRQSGATVAQIGCLIELTALDGQSHLGGSDGTAFFSLLQY